MQIIISSGSNNKVEANKLEVEIDELSKVKMEVEVDEAMIFSTINLMTNPISKLYAIAYNSKAKMLLVTCLHFIDNQ